MSFSQDAHGPALNLPKPVFNIPAPVSSSFCLPHESQFKIIEPREWCSQGTYQVVDLAGNFLFKFSDNSFWSSNQIGLDDSGRPIVYLKQKEWSLHNTWDAYRGEKKLNPEDLLFTMKLASLCQRKTSYNIWLNGNQTADFTLSADSWQKHYKLSFKDVIIAEADYKFKFFKASELVVTANAGVDRMFIAAILVIFQIASTAAA